MPGFMEDYNRRFAVEPQQPVDAHRPVHHSDAERSLILSLHYPRSLSKNLTCQFHNREIQVQTRGPGYTLRRAVITVCEAFDGTLTLLYKGQPLKYRILAEGEPPVPLADEKGIAEVVTRARANQGHRIQWKPPPDHPWRRYQVTTAERAG